MVDWSRTNAVTGGWVIGSFVVQVVATRCNRVIMVAVKRFLSRRR